MNALPVVRRNIIFSTKQLLHRLVSEFSCRRCEIYLGQVRGLPGFCQPKLHVFYAVDYMVFLWTRNTLGPEINMSFDISHIDRAKFRIRLSVTRTESSACEWWKTLTIRSTLHTTSWHCMSLFSFDHPWSLWGCLRIDKDPSSRLRDKYPCRNGIWKV